MDEAFIVSRSPYSDQTITYSALVANSARDKLTKEHGWEMRSANLPDNGKSFTWSPRQPVR